MTKKLFYDDDRYLKFEFWPSDSEILESKKKNVYLGNFTEFYESVDRIKDQLMREKYLWFHEFREQPSANFESPPIIEVLISLSAGGGAVGLYKLLQEWVKYINGRKIRVRYGGIEFETTHMSKKEFLRFFDTILKKIQLNRESMLLEDDQNKIQNFSNSIQKKFRNDLHDIGCEFRSVDSEERLKDLGLIRK